MGKTAPIEAIATDRTLDPGDDLTKLAESIRSDGLQVPVLVNQEYELIDGLRRLEAVRSLGNADVEVVAVTLLQPAMAWIKRAREHGVEAKPLTPRRIWELYSAVQPIVKATRSHLSRGTRHGRGVNLNARQAFVEATGIDGESRLQVITQTYRTALVDGHKGELGREALKRMESGEFTPYMAVDYVRRNLSRGEVVATTEQQAILTSVATTLNGVGFGIAQLGTLDPAINAKAYPDIHRDLTKFRRALYQLIRQLEKEQDTA